jgi:hypothetical protein
VLTPLLRLPVLALVLTLFAGCNGGDRAVLNALSAHPAPAPPVEVTNIAFAFQQLPSLTVPAIYPVGVTLANGNGGIGEGTRLNQPLNIYAVPTGSLTFGESPGTATAQTLQFTTSQPQFFVALDPKNFSSGSIPTIYATTIDTHGRTIQITLAMSGQMSAVSITLSDASRRPDAR